MLIHVCVKSYSADLDQNLKRAYLEDPSFLSNMTQHQRNIISDAISREIKSKISDNYTLPVSAYIPEGLESLETLIYHHLFSICLYAR